MYNPVSTYRIQFHKGFNFKQFRAVLPYLTDLGVKTVYASPVFSAAPGSMHGYDVTDPLTINPEIGTLSELRGISKQLKKAGIGWLQDIVPNHMAFHPENKWLMDVLEHGRTSTWANFFDILWDVDPVLMVPFLGKHLEATIDDGELTIVFEKKKACFSYFGQHYPLSPASVSRFLIKKSNIQKINGDPRLLKEIAGAQYYRLCNWAETNTHINYRRFFTVNGLICLNMQEQAVFDTYHHFIAGLVKEGIFQGLRVDHIDGLYDPASYLAHLRALAGDEVYIVTEKILEAGESFPSGWPVQGNTGYDTLAVLNNLFTFGKSRKTLSDLYHGLSKSAMPFKRQVAAKKRFILENYMHGELENLTQLLLSLIPGNTKQPDIKEAIAEILVQCPVYRYYGDNTPLKGIFGQIKKDKPKLTAAIDLVSKALYLEKSRHFYNRLMQFTGPLMAKGVEDTLMYTYDRFIGHNEVGDSPDAFGMRPENFHRLMTDRSRQWPLSLTTTATHDTKRGEEVRARLNALTELADEWSLLVKEWLQQQSSIDPNDAYFIYQTIAGALPMPGEPEDDFPARLNAYLVKALREGKVNSGWADPDEAYEAAAQKFASALLENGSAFRKSFDPFLCRLADLGIVNSLSQVLIKYTMPGVPDLYQGCEFWDLSLVDPDNRRPVDYRRHAAFLSAEPADWKQLWASRYSGAIKQRLTNLLLQQRSEHPALFSYGDYIPLKITGRYRLHVLAFARYSNDHWLLSVVPLHTGVLTGGSDLLNFDWDDTTVVLPENAPHSWRSLISGAKGYAGKNIPVATLFDCLPLALARLENPYHRGAGILMHITSLPAGFGVGDIGPQARRFADFLFSAGQRIWQLLPVGPVDENSDFSPYSSSSAMAGNTLLISPEMLSADGFLNNRDLGRHLFPVAEKVDYEAATRNKNALFDLAYRNFITQMDSTATDQFEKFKREEAYWLDDFALYEVLKSQHENRPWFSWPEPYKMRDAAALKALAKKYSQKIDQVKWLQFIFASQWAKFKAYCYGKGISLVGDLPFYTSYDSADVWAAPQFFKLDAKGGMTGIAGVPPDYFSAEGQLWGMPVYDWETLKKDGYRWWIDRFRKNLEYFDLLRLDHFRAFADFWEVPAGSPTAITGCWQPGPGSNFFEQVKAALGRLPFLAEDLGDIDEPVYRLRDDFGLPGMRVLQFAFDEAMPVSPHIPHNYTLNSFAYTGTHDNNTALGWYRQDADKKTRKRLKKYTGQSLSSKNIHQVLIRLCYASAAAHVVIPLQDILGLGEAARMNNPALASGNWRWRLKPGILSEAEAKYLKKLTAAYNR